MMLSLKCALCDSLATQTAAQIPVCDRHREAYDEEGQKYLPDSQRPVYRALLAALDKPKR